MGKKDQTFGTFVQTDTNLQLDMLKEVVKDDIRRAGSWMACVYVHGCAWGGGRGWWWGG